MKETQKGSAALEYLIVTTFATIAAIVLLGVVSHLTKEKIESIKGKLGVDISEIDLNVWGP